MKDDLMQAVKIVDVEAAQKYIGKIVADAKAKHINFPTKKVEKLNDTLVDFYKQFDIEKASVEEINKKMNEIAIAQANVVSDAFPIFPLENKKRMLCEAYEQAMNLYIHCKMISACNE